MTISRSWDGGAGIYTSGSLMMDGVTIQNNTGGGVFSVEGVVTARACVIQNNTSRGPDGFFNFYDIPAGSGAGGGVASLFGVLTMDGCSIQNNAAIGGDGERDLRVTGHPLAIRPLAETQLKGAAAPAPAPKTPAALAATAAVPSAADYMYQTLPRLCTTSRSPRTVQLEAPLAAIPKVGPTATSATH